MTVWVPSDTRADVTNTLRALLDDQPGIGVGTRLPTGQTPLPYVLVADDDTRMLARHAAQWTLIRLTVWAGDDDTAWDLVGLAAGRLLAHRSATIRGVSWAGGILRTTDPDTQHPMASTVLRVNAYPTTA